MDRSRRILRRNARDWGTDYSREDEEMSLVVERALFFIQDFEKQFAWYVEKANPEVAWRFHSALDVSLLKLSRQPDLGRLEAFGL